MNYPLFIILIITLFIFAGKSFQKETTATKVLSNEKPINMDSISSKLISTILYFVFDYWTILRGKLNATIH